jgi:hypothetical protein
MVVTDAFPLPVDGIEYRVDLGPEGDEYLINYLEMAKSVGDGDVAGGCFPFGVSRSRMVSPCPLCTVS